MENKHSYRKNYYAKSVIRTVCYPEVDQTVKFMDVKFILYLIATPGIDLFDKSIWVQKVLPHQK